ncbi:MAG TPA: LPXTG cell wall anchor domain-containing protein, partial [Acidobacteriota bacterium]|nr:LPXTG cell wall anchor domain-containing protein [Acidobacteriota bacterium]
IPRAGLFLGITLVLICAAPRASGSEIPAPDVTVSIDRREATVGDPITLTLRVVHDPAFHLTPAIPGRLMGPFEVLSDSLVSDARLEDDRQIYERIWRVAAFRPGTYWLPMLGGGLADSTGAAIAWQSDSIAITIVSVLTQADIDSADIHGLKASWEASVPLSVWWYVLGGAVLLALAGVWIWRRRKQPLAEPAVPSVPPWETALDDLQVMQHEIDAASDGGRLWYFRLSEILRRYVDGRYEWQSIDQTTTEILRQLKKAPFDGLHRERFREFLSVADRVRYARAHAQVGRPAIDWDWAKEFVQDTMPRLHMPETDNVTGAEDRPRSEGGES